MTGLEIPREERLRLLEVATLAAREAAQIVHAGWRKHPVAEHKGVIDLVTSFDRESERFLRDRLTRDSHYPVMGEELGGYGGSGVPEGDAATWYVDPLDGTTNFVHGHFFYCVSIGLVLRGKPLLGAVVAPAVRTEGTGIVGEGAWRNGEACRPSGVTTFGESLLATGFPYDRRTSAENNFDAFVAIKKSAQAVRRCGSAAMDLCLVADGTYDGYWERKLKSWDLAAGAAVVLAAGGRVTDFEGGPADVMTGNLVATNGLIHETLLAELARVRSPHA